MQTGENKMIRLRITLLGLITTLLMSGCATVMAPAMPAPAGAANAASGVAGEAAGIAGLVSMVLNQAASGIAGSSTPAVEAGWVFTQLPWPEGWKMNIDGDSKITHSQSVETEFGTVKVEGGSRCHNDSTNIWVRFTFTDKHSGAPFITERGKQLNYCDNDSIKPLANELRKHFEEYILPAIRDKVRRMAGTGPRQINQAEEQMLKALEKVTGGLITALRQF